MRFLKNILKHTFVYDLFLRQKFNRIKRTWTPQDYKMKEFYSSFWGAGRSLFRYRCECWKPNQDFSKPRSHCCRSRTAGFMHEDSENHVWQG